jgi:hypothetical protein
VLDCRIVLRRDEDAEDPQQLAAAAAKATAFRAAEKQDATISSMRSADFCVWFVLIRISLRTSKSWGVYPTFNRCRYFEFIDPLKQSVTRSAAGYLFRFNTQLCRFHEKLQLKCIVNFRHGTTPLLRHRREYDWSLGHRRYAGMFSR